MAINLEEIELAIMVCAHFLRLVLRVGSFRLLHTSTIPVSLVPPVMGGIQPTALKVLVLLLMGIKQRLLWPRGRSEADDNPGHLADGLRLHARAQKGRARVGLFPLRKPWGRMDMCMGVWGSLPKVGPDVQWQASRRQPGARVVCLPPCLLCWQGPSRRRWLLLHRPRREAAASTRVLTRARPEASKLRAAPYLLEAVPSHPQLPQRRHPPHRQGVQPEGSASTWRRRCA